MNGPEAPRAALALAQAPTITLAPAVGPRQWPDLLTSIIGIPAVSSLIQGAGEGISSIANNPDVTSVVGSVWSIVASGVQETRPPQPASTDATPTLTPTPTPTPNPSVSEAKPSASKPNIGAIVGGVVGGVAALALLAALIFLLLRRRKDPRRDHASLFENERFVGADGTPGLVDPYAHSSPSSPSRHTDTLTTSSGDVYHTPSPPKGAHVPRAPLPPPPLTTSHASIPTVATGTGTFGPRGSTDSERSGFGAGVYRSNTVTSTGSRPLPPLPLSRSGTLSRSQGDLHRAATMRSASDVRHSLHSSGHDLHPDGLGADLHDGRNLRGPLTPYPEESPMGERPPHMVEHAVDAADAGGRGRKVLPPMYNAALYERA